MSDAGHAMRYGSAVRRGACHPRRSV